MIKSAFKSQQFAKHSGRDMVYRNTFSQNINHESLQIYERSVGSFLQLIWSSIEQLIMRGICVLVHRQETQIENYNKKF